MFFNQTQTSYYDFSILREIKTHPFTALASYVVTVIKDCYKVLVSAWLEIFHFPSPEILGQRTFLMYAAICLILFVSVLICLYFLRNSIDPKGKKPAIQLILNWYCQSDIGRTAILAD